MFKQRIQHSTLQTAVQMLQQSDCPQVTVESALTDMVHMLMLQGTLENYRNSTESGMVKTSCQHWINQIKANLRVRQQAVVPRSKPCRRRHRNPC
jgi:hypothetical protein